MNRVVITGIGAVTPIGNDVKSFWDGLINGKKRSGLHFPTSTTALLNARWLLKVKNFDPSSCMDSNTVRRMDLFSQYGMYAAHEAMEDSGIQSAIDSEDLGVLLSVRALAASIPSAPKTATLSRAV